MSRVGPDPIEGRLREALAATPTLPTSTDPLGDLDRRLRRARRRLTAGAGVVAAAVAAAIVVPLTVTGGHDGRHAEVRVITPATQTPPPAAPDTTALWTGNAVSVSANAAGERWLLYADGSESHVTAVTGRKTMPFQVPQPADHVVAGDNVVWVIGGGDGRTKSTLTAIRPADKRVATRDFPAQSFSFGTVVGDYLFVDVSGGSGDRTDLFQLTDSGQIRTFGSHPLPHAAEMVTAGGAVWVHAADKLAQLFLSERGIDTGVTVPWGSGQIFTPTLPRSAPGGLWAYDGNRLIGLMPKALAGCVSCAEGDRVTVPGRPSAVVETRDGLYVSVPGSGLYYYTADTLGAGQTPVSASIQGVQVIAMAADPAGGVDYVDDRGDLIHWAPPAR